MLKSQWSWAHAASRAVLGLSLLGACSADGDSASHGPRRGSPPSAGSGATAAGSAGDPSATTDGRSGSAGSPAFGNVTAGTSGGASDAPAMTTPRDAGLPPASFDAGACGPMGTPTAATAEVCDNGLDDDLNGFIDEVCPCTLDATQPCFGGRPWEAELPNCTRGTQTCTGTDEFHGWGKCTGFSCGDVAAPEESCDDGSDEDCDGAIDEGCELDVPVDIDGDCLSVACPPQAPYPSGCELTMEGGDSRGCVANTPGQSTVYFQEGDACPIFGIAFGDVGHIAGRLLCSTQMPSEPLSATSCPIDKSEPLYPADASGCPVP